MIPTTLPTHPAAITGHARLSLCQPPVRSSRWLLRKNSLRHFEHIRNESLESLEMDTTLNYQTFQNPELWSVGPSHELHQSRKQSGCGLRLGLCGVKRESTLGSKIYWDSKRAHIRIKIMVRHMDQSSQRRQSLTRFPSKGSALGIDLRQGRGKRFSLRISLEGVDFRLQSRSTVGFKIILRFKRRAQYD